MARASKGFRWQKWLAGWVAVSILGPIAALAPAAPDPIVQSFQTAGELFKAGKLAEAEAECARTLALAEAAVGRDDPRLLPTLLLYAEIAKKAGRLSDAEQRLVRALQLAERDPRRQLVARTGYMLMLVQLAQFRYDEAWVTGKAALQQADADRDEMMAAQLLARLAQVIAKRGTEPAQALVYIERLVAWLDRQGNPDLAALRDSARLILAKLLAVVGRLADAEAQLERVSQAVAAAGDPVQQAAANPNSADLLADLGDTRASLQLARGDSAAALQSAEEALKLLSKWPQLRGRRADLLGTLAGIQLARGNAEAGLQAASAAVALLGAPDQTRDLVRALNTLARAQVLGGKAAAALQTQERALQLQRTLKGQGHLAVLQAEISLARILLVTGQAERAATQLQQTLAQLAKVPGEPSVTTGAAESVLAAALELRDGAEEPALKATDRALDLLRRQAGDDSSDLVSEHGRRSRLLWRLGRPAEAVAAARQADRLRELVLGAGLGAGSERERRQLVAALQPATDWAVHLALHATQASDEAAVLAAEDVLRRRGRQIDAMAGTLRGLRQSLTPEHAKLLDELQQARMTLAATIQAPEQPGDLERFDRLKSAQSRVGELEDRASRALLALRGELQPVTLTQIQAAIPAGALLLEFWVHQPPLGGKDRLAVLLLAADRPPQWRDLGELAPLQAVSREWTARLRNPAAADVHERGEAVVKALLEPLQTALEGRTALLVVPDGPLHQLPLGALPLGRDPQGRQQFALQKWEISLLSTGRDLLRWTEPAAPRHPGLVLADPAFGAPAGDHAWGALPGARAEGTAVVKLLGKQAELRVGEAANRAALATRPAPRVLHLATHGWFDVVRAATKNPLAGVGLALAGANAGTDGRLTGLDLASLDLHGTELVTLSACETGLGVSLNGDGVYGLQRALVLAGARSVVMSLWKVDDAATAKLMTAMYGELRKGVPRGQALRRGQLAVLAALQAPGKGGKGKAAPGTGTTAALKGNRGAEVVGAEPVAGAAADHPYFWGAFVLAGERGPVGLR
ncbi:MAG: CHAT domain-containing protein [Deltaproteobacteria bacterium]|nr:CHAT domain-containing protein [Deltaproteobacteria bacterium]